MQVKLKRKILLFSIVGIIISLFAYGTLAYFTAEKTTKNIITTGNIDIELHDETTGGIPFPEEGIQGVMPGKVIDKIVYVENIESNPLYTRIKIQKMISSPDNSEAILNFDKIKLNINSDYWLLKEDGYYYYKEKLEKGEKTEPLFTTVSFGIDIGNQYENANIEIDVLAQAVQSQNNGEDVIEALGWPKE